MQTVEWRIANGRSGECGEYDVIRTPAAQEMQMKGSHAIVVAMVLITEAGCGGTEVANGPISESPGIVGIKVASSSVPEDIAKLRQRAIETIWGAGLIPSDPPEAIEVDVAPADRPDTRVANLTAAERVDAITFEMDFGFRSVAYYFHPVGGAERGLVIFHQGHVGLLYSLSAINRALENGYAVLGFNMLFIDDNEVLGPVVIEDQTITFDKNRLHNDLEQLEELGYSAMSYLLEPVARGVTWAINTYNPKEIHMMGLSGGGWTTMVYSALDPRIKYSFPVALGLPFHLRDTPIDHSDFEQHEERALYGVVDYLDLYMLAAAESHRAQLQAYNAFDNCCFAANEKRQTMFDVATEVKERLQGIGGGEFKLFIDETNHSHSVSESIMDVFFLFINEREE